MAGAALAAMLGAGCKKHEIPAELVGSYARSGDIPAELRAELSVGRGGMVLTVVKLTASADVGTFASLFADKKSAVASSGSSASVGASTGRSVVSARAFDKVACDASSCTFELAGDKTSPACGGSFERVQNTIIVVASGPCQPYSGRWLLLEGAAPPVPSASQAPSAAPTVPAPVGTVRVDVPPIPVPPVPTAPPPGKLVFPADVPVPHDHMSCLSACSIVDTRCHRTSPSGREAFLACVEKHEICRAQCEEVWPFFGK